MTRVGSLGKRPCMSSRFTPYLERQFVRLQRAHGRPSRPWVHKTFSLPSYVYFISLHPRPQLGLSTGRSQFTDLEYACKVWRLQSDLYISPLAPPRAPSSTPNTTFDQPYEYQLSTTQPQWPHHLQTISTTSPTWLPHRQRRHRRSKVSNLGILPSPLPPLTLPRWNDSSTTSPTRRVQTPATPTKHIRHLRRPIVPSPSIPASPTPPSSQSRCVWRSTSTRFPRRWTEPSLTSILVRSPSVSL
jgi:hypothetical protein